MATENATEPIVLRPGESRNGAPFAVFGDLALVKLSSRDTQGRLAICELVVEPDGSRSAQTHQYEDQWFYVAEGRIEFEVLGVRSVMDAGASIYIPRNRSYRYDGVGSARARLLVVAVPGGLDLFYAELSLSLGEHRSTEEGDKGCLLKHGVLLTK